MDLRPLAKRLTQPPPPPNAKNETSVDFLSGLNPQQCEAVAATDGAVLHPRRRGQQGQKPVPRTVSLTSLPPNTSALRRPRCNRYTNKAAAEMRAARRHPAGRSGTQFLAPALFPLLRLSCAATAMASPPSGPVSPKPSPSMTTKTSSPSSNQPTAAWASTRRPCAHQTLFHQIQPRQRPERNSAGTLQPI